MNDVFNTCRDADINALLAGHRAHEGAKGQLPPGRHEVRIFNLDFGALEDRIAAHLCSDKYDVIIVDSIRSIPTLRGLDRLPRKPNKEKRGKRPKPQPNRGPCKAKDWM